MEFKTLPGGEKIPSIGMGTWRLGGNSTPDTSQDQKVLQALETALDLGYRHIDTAEMYGGGHTEELVGMVIKNFPRQDLFITSKVWPTHLRYNDLLQACRGSLQRLGLDYLDLYLIHWPDESVPLSESFRALNELVRQGLARHIGVSNFDLDQLRRAAELAEAPIATNQVPYSLFNREYVENGVLEYCQRNGILLTAYTPVEKGRVNNERLVREIAARHQATAAQVALNWLVRQPNVITIPMSTNPQHLRENLEATRLELSPEEVAQLDRLGG